MTTRDQKSAVEAESRFILTGARTAAGLTCRRLDPLIAATLEVAAR